MEYTLDDLRRMRAALANEELVSLASLKARQGLHPPVADDVDMVLIEHRLQTAIMAQVDPSEFPE